jgi:hypothetical protein
MTSGAIALELAWRRAASGRHGLTTVSACGGAHEHTTQHTLSCWESARLGLDQSGLGQQGHGRHRQVAGAWAGRGEGRKRPSQSAAQEGLGGSDCDPRPANPAPRISSCLASLRRPHLLKKPGQARGSSRAARGVPIASRSAEASASSMEAKRAELGVAGASGAGVSFGDAALAESGRPADLPGEPFLVFGGDVRGERLAPEEPGPAASGAGPKSVNGCSSRSFSGPAAAGRALDTSTRRSTSSEASPLNRWDAGFIVAAWGCLGRREGPVVGPVLSVAGHCFSMGPPGVRACGGS